MRHISGFDRRSPRHAAVKPSFPPAPIASLPRVCPQASNLKLRLLQQIAALCASCEGDPSEEEMPCAHSFPSPPAPASPAGNFPLPCYLGLENRKRAALVGASLLLSDSECGSGNRRSRCLSPAGIGSALLHRRERGSNFRPPVSRCFLTRNFRLPTHNRSLHLRNRTDSWQTLNRENARFMVQKAAKRAASSLLSNFCE